MGGNMAKPQEQNFQVSATGGAGTNGQPARYAAGIDNAGEFYDIQTQARMAGKNPAVSRVPSPSGQRPFRGDSAEPLVPLDSPTQRPKKMSAWVQPWVWKACTQLTQPLAQKI